MYEHKQAALLILHLFQACSEELLWHVLKLEADKSGEDLNIFKSVPRKGIHLPLKWTSPSGLFSAEILPQETGTGKHQSRQDELFLNQNIVKLWFCQWLAARGFLDM